MKIAISTHPERKTQLILRSLRLYGHVFIPVFFLALLLAIIVFLPRLLGLTLGIDFLQLAPLDPERFWLILINLAALVLFSGILWRARCIVTGAHESLVDDIKVALKKIPYTLIALILQNLLILVVVSLFFYFLFYSFYYHHQEADVFMNTATQWLLAAALLIQCIFVLYIFFSFYFYLPIIIIENQGIIPSLRKSMVLVWGNWWKTFIVQMTPWLAYLICLILVKAITGVNIHIYFVGTFQDPSWIAYILHVVIFAIFIPWVATTLLVQLRDLELRKSTPLK